MFGLQFIKFQPNVYAIRHSNGRIVSQGPGLSFFYYAPTTSLTAVPLSSVETPFIFEEVTADYQSITIQGQVTYRVGDAGRIAGILNYTLDQTGRSYASDDPAKLPQRIVNMVQVLTKKQVLRLTLREALRSADAIAENVLAGLRDGGEAAALGLDVLNLAVLAVHPKTETSRALEAEARETILREADDAVYRRRNASVEQERRIKENELNTEIAVENKKRQIREARMDADEAMQVKKHKLDAAQMQFSIRQEAEKHKLVELTSQNTRSEADARSYSLSATMGALKDADPLTIQALANMGMQPNQLIAQAFQGLAANAGKIGQLHISPDLLSELLDK
jgi:hypothetical protein